MSIWDKIINFQEQTEQTINDNFDRNIAAIKRKTSGPRWKIIKTILGGLTVAAAIALILSYWAVLVLIIIVSIILGLAAKS